MIFAKGYLTPKLHWINKVRANSFSHSGKLGFKQSAELNVNTMQQQHQQTTAGHAM